MELLLKSNLWIVKVLAIGLFAFLLSRIESKIYRRLFPKLTESPRLWDDALLYAIHLPLKGYLYATGCILSLPLFGVNFEAFPFSLEKIYKWICGFLFIWALFRLIKHVEKNFSSPKKLESYDPTTVRGIIQGLKGAVFAIALLAILQMAGVPLSGVIAFGGMGGIAIGLAARELLANFFGGLMIFLDRPFQIGEWVRSPDKEIEGIVEHIGWRHTRIKTLDKRPLFVPNSVFLTISLENPSRMSNRQIKTRINLCYEDLEKIPEVLEEIEKMLSQHLEIDSKQPFYAKLIDFSPHSFVVEIKGFTKTTDLMKYVTVQQDVFFKLSQIVHKHGARFGCPTVPLAL